VARRGIARAEASPTLWSRDGIVFKVIPSMESIEAECLRSLRHSSDATAARHASLEWSRVLEGLIAASIATISGSSLRGGFWLRCCAHARL